MKVAEVISHVVREALRLQERCLWERFTNYDCFAVEIPGEDDPMLGVILGDAGEEYGLNLFRGPLAHACLNATLHPGPQGDDFLQSEALRSHGSYTGKRGCHLCV